MQNPGMAIVESFDDDIHDNTRVSLGRGNSSVSDDVFDLCSKCEHSSTFYGNVACPRDETMSLAR